MGDIVMILWVPVTIACMAVAFVVTLGTVGDTSGIRSVALGDVSATARDDRVTHD